MEGTECVAGLPPGQRVVLKPPACIPEWLPNKHNNQLALLPFIQRRLWLSLLFSSLKCSFFLASQRVSLLPPFCPPAPDTCAAPTSHPSTTEQPEHLDQIMSPEISSGFPWCLKKIQVFFPWPAVPCMSRSLPTLLTMQPPWLRSIS